MYIANCARTTSVYRRILPHRKEKDQRLCRDQLHERYDILVCEVIFVCVCLLCFTWCFLLAYLLIAGYRCATVNAVCLCIMFGITWVHGLRCCYFECLDSLTALTRTHAHTHKDVYIAFTRTPYIHSYCRFLLQHVGQGQAKPFHYRCPCGRWRSCCLHGRQVAVSCVQARGMLSHLFRQPTQHGGLHESCSAKLWFLSAWSECVYVYIYIINICMYVCMCVIGTYV